MKLQPIAAALLMTLTVTLSGCIVEQGPDDNAPPPPPDQQVQAAPAPVSAPVPADPQLQQLAAPIALYPDPLLADVLPASTYPQDVQAAYQFVQGNPTPSSDQIASFGWDPSVQALCYYPTVLQMMASDPQWTASLGSAFTYEQPQLMDAIQELRAQAQTDGNLDSSSDIQVVQQGPEICILPAQPDYVYVPQYDPYWVYHHQGYPINYGPQYHAQYLVQDIDWNNHTVDRSNWHQDWTHAPSGQWQQVHQPAQVWTHNNQRAPIQRVNQYTPPKALDPARGGQTFKPVRQRTAAPQPAPQRTNPQPPKYTAQPAPQNPPRQQQQYQAPAQQQQPPRQQQYQAPAQQQQPQHQAPEHQTPPQQEPPQHQSPAQQQPPRQQYQPPVQQQPPAHQAPPEHQAPIQQPPAHQPPPQQQPQHPAPPEHQAPPQPPAHQAPAPQQPPTHQAPAEHQAPAQQQPPQHSAGGSEQKPTDHSPSAGRSGDYPEEGK